MKADIRGFYKRCLDCPGLKQNLHWKRNLPKWAYGYDDTSLGFAYRRCGLYIHSSYGGMDPRMFDFSQHELNTTW